MFSFEMHIEIRNIEQVSSLCANKNEYGMLFISVQNGPVVGRNCLVTVRFCYFSFAPLNSL